MSDALWPLCGDARYLFFVGNLSFLANTLEIQPNEYRTLNCVTRHAADGYLEVFTVWFKGPLHWATGAFGICADHLPGGKMYTTCASTFVPHTISGVNGARRDQNASFYFITMHYFRYLKFESFLYERGHPPYVHVCIGWGHVSCFFFFFMVTQVACTSNQYPRKETTLSRLLFTSV